MDSHREVIQVEMAMYHRLDIAARSARAANIGITLDHSTVTKQDECRGRGSFPETLELKSLV